MDIFAWLLSQLIITIILIFTTVLFYIQALRYKSMIAQRRLYLGFATFTLINTLIQLGWTIDRWYLALVHLVEYMRSVIFLTNIHFIGGGTPEIYFALALIWSTVPLIWPVEKYLRNSKRFALSRNDMAVAIAKMAMAMLLVRDEKKNGVSS